MTDIEIIHKLLFYAFLDIRESSREFEDKVSFRLSDLFHSITGHMQKAAMGECTYKDVLLALRTRAENKGQGCQEWLEDRMRQIEHWKP
jgi:hypothetical protein